MSIVVEIVKIVWGGSLLAIVSFGAICAVSPAMRARIGGGDATLRDGDRQDV